MSINVLEYAVKNFPAIFSVFCFDGILKTSVMTRSNNSGLLNKAAN